MGEGLKGGAVTGTGIRHRFTAPLWATALAAGSFALALVSFALASIFPGTAPGTGAGVVSPGVQAEPHAGAEPDRAVWQLVVEGPADPVLASFTRLLVVPLGPDGCFGIEYRHSVEQTPVVDWFQVEPGAAEDEPHMVLRATEYRSFGAGLPTEAPPGARFRHLGDRFLIEGLDVPVSSLVVRPLVFTEHVLIVGEDRWALSGLASDGVPLRLYVEKRSD